MCPSLLCCLATLSCSRVGHGDINKAHDLWPIQQLVNPRTPTSEQFIIEGLTFWCNGCKSRVGTKKVDSRCTVKLNLLSTPQGMKKGLAFLTLALNHPNTATVCYSFINCKEDLSDSGNATKEVELLGAKRDYYEALLCLSSVNSASVCAPTSAPRLVRLTPDSASVHPPPSAPRLLRLMKQTICGHSRPTNFKRPITRFVLTS
jgi:hypothetical protein